MREFEIASAEPDLGTIRIAASNVEKYRANFCALLDPGVVINGFTATVTSLDAVTNGFLSNDQKTMEWLIEATDDPSTFDFNLTVTTTDGQSLNYVVHYVVEATSA